ncbi:MAG TPA: hypothetical protein VF092_16960 [Longimicrobium sp.]
MKTTGYLAAALAAITLTACGDGTGSDLTPGSLAFTYEGARSGSYSASGTFERASDSTFAKQPFAVGAKGSDGANAFVSILSYLPVTAATGHMVLFALPNVTAPTTLNVDAGCATAECPAIAVVFDTNPDESEDEADFYVFESGTIEVTSVSSSRMRGTFSGTATEFFGDQSITVTNGTFDVPLVNPRFLLTRTLPAARIESRQR